MPNVAPSVKTKSKQFFSFIWYGIFIEIPRIAAGYVPELVLACFCMGLQPAAARGVRSLCFLFTYELYGVLPFCLKQIDALVQTGNIDLGSFGTLYEATVGGIDADARRFADSLKL